MMKRFGTVCGLKAECVEEYTRVHAAVWPEVLATIAACNVTNYSIYLRKLPDGKFYLFSYFEYVGEDYAADMAKMAADPATLRWWDVCKPMMEPVADRKDGEWQAAMDEVFHVE